MRRIEQQNHIAIVRFLRAVLPTCLVLHVPNGGLRSKREAALLKAMGVLPGVPDIMILRPYRQPVFLEVKAPGGRLSPEQRQIHEALRDMGHAVAVLQDIDDARKALRGLGIPTVEVALTAPVAQAEIAS